MDFSLVGKCTYRVPLCKYDSAFHNTEFGSLQGTAEIVNSLTLWTAGTRSTSTQGKRIGVNAFLVRFTHHQASAATRKPQIRELHPIQKERPPISSLAVSTITGQNQSQEKCTSPHLRHYKLNHFWSKNSNNKSQTATFRLNVVLKLQYRSRRNTQEARNTNKIPTHPGWRTRWAGAAFVHTSHMLCRVIWSVVSKVK